MSNYVTLVVRMPDDESAKATVQQAFRLLEPHQTAMSLEDEMTILELIEQHEAFDSSIADEAREKASELHTLAETN